MCVYVSIFVNVQKKAWNHIWGPAAWACLASALGDKGVKCGATGRSEQRITWGDAFLKASPCSCVENKLVGNRSGSSGPVRLPQVSRREILVAWTLRGGGWVGVVTGVESRSSTSFLPDALRGREEDRGGRPLGSWLTDTCVQGGCMHRDVHCNPIC